MVFLTHRHAAAGQNQVMVLSGCTQRGFGGLTLIGNDAQVSDLAPQALQQRAQEKSVGVVNGAHGHLVWRNIARHHQFIARRKQSDSRGSRHFQFRQTHASGHS